MIVFIADNEDKHFAVLIDSENEESHHRTLVQLFIDLGYKINKSDQETWFQYCYISKDNYTALIVNEDNEVSKVEYYVREYSGV